MLRRDLLVNATRREESISSPRVRSAPWIFIQHVILMCDARISSWLYRRNHGLLHHAAIVLSALGAQRLLIPCAGLATLAVLLDQRFAAALVLVVATVVSRVCSWMAKRLVPRTRPAVSGLSINSSFPSGHTMAAIAIYGTIALIFFRP